MVQLYSKLSLGLFFITCLIAPVSAQVNTYFENNPVWLVNSSCSAPLPCVRYDDYNLYVNGDTVINGLTYVKIFRKGSYHFDWFSSPPVPQNCTGMFSYIDTFPSYFLRSDGKQIYIFTSNAGGTEELLYDFDLAIGDTLPLTYNNYDPLITVTGIDSLYTPYGYRKRFALSQVSLCVTELIEGIGSDHGLIEPVSCALDCSWNLSCFSLNDTAWYPVTGPTCELNIGLQENMVGMNTIKVSPNPFSDYVIFNWGVVNKNFRLSIYSTDGKTVKIADDLQDDHYVLYRETLVQGIYFYDLQSDVGSSTRGKLVITN